MTYSGDPSLAPDIRRRILSTFRQTLDLAAEGSHHEAVLGCDFILQMDPQFGPARALQERLNGAPGMPVEVDDLRAGVPGPNELEELAELAEPAADRDAEAEALFDDLDETDLEAGVSAARPAAEPDPELGSRIAERLEVRDFSGVLELSRQWPGAIAGDPELARLVETATARQEAAPYVQRFLDAARRAHAEGDGESAATMLEKARSLDPTHPGLRDLVARLKAPPPAPPPAEAEPPAAEMAPSEALLAALEQDRDSESAERIDELLAAGQQEFDGGDYQAAIDAWSRIFLIDIDHDEASRRIEEARRLKAEQERQIEEVFHDASDQLEGGDRAAAQRGFEKVMELEPGHLAAREYLDRLAQEEPGRPAPGAASPPSGPAPTRDRGAGVQPVLKEEILVPPEDLEARPAPEPEERPRVAVAEPGGARRRFVVIGSAVLAVVAVAMALTFLNRDRLFPNASETPITAAVDPIARATGLHEGGKTAMAISQLRRLPPTDPHYEQAQALISQWEAVQTPADTATEDAPPAFELARRQDLIAAAVDAVSRNENMLAAERLDQAAAIAPLDGDDAELRSSVTRALAPITHEIELFRQGEYEMGLPGLWRLHETEPANPDVRRLIVDSYYNLAVRDLQRSDARAAASKLDEAIGLAPDDPELARHRLFAQAYRNREKDLLYRIYVKYLPFR